MNYKHKNYLINTPSKLGKTGDFEPYLWYITNNLTNQKFSYITRTSGTRIATKNINDEEHLLKDAWNFVKFYLDQEKETDGFIIVINSNSELGSFYTPKQVVQCITDLLICIKDEEDKINQRWQSHKDVPHFPVVIDPACGEGIFLKQAIVQGLTKKQWIFGLDLDPEAVNKWETTNLLQEFNGDKKSLKAHFFHQNGLLPIQWSQHKEYYRGNLSKKYQEKEQFDFVVGNPPYGGLGIYEEMKQLLEMLNPTITVKEVTVTKLDLFGGEKTEISKSKKNTNNEILTKEKIKELLALSKSLLKFSIWKDQKKNPKIHTDHIVSFNGLKINYADILDGKEIEKLKSYPIEVLFLERFIKLAKLPNKNKKGGVVAVIIPDGILSNSTMDYVRQFISSQTKVLGIISLPRGTFKEAKTNAKTSILLLEKTNDQDISQNYPVFLASLPEIKDEYFVIINNYFTQFMTQQKPTQFIDEANGLMIRTDKTLKDLNTEKPNSRWDGDFWNPKYDLILKELKIKYKTDYLENFIESIGQGDVPRKNREEKFINVNDGVKFIEVENIIDTGINFHNTRFVMKKQYERLKRVSLKVNSILIVRSGATIGKIALVPKQFNEKAIINGHVNIFSVKNINPSFVVIFMKTVYGQMQLDRLKRGVAQPELNYAEINSVLIPIIENNIQIQIEERLAILTLIHEKAMEARVEGKEIEYKDNLTKAQELLKDLVIKTEAVIRGERENVD